MSIEVANFIDIVNGLLGYSVSRDRLLVCARNHATDLYYATDDDKYGVMIEELEELIHMN